VADTPSGMPQTAITRAYRALLKLHELPFGTTVACTSVRAGYSTIMTGKADAAIDPAKVAGQHPGDTTRLGSAVRGPAGRRTLTMKLEARVATGEFGEALAQAQAAAIREILAWIEHSRESSENGA
jgi:hypothetical protein